MYIVQVCDEVNITVDAALCSLYDGNNNNNSGDDDDDDDDGNCI